ncbi:MAG TPA: zf-HC2 domain-containing protein [Pseudomonadales bacterium]
MQCEYGNATLDDYFDHALDASAQTLFLAHCRQCPECRAEVDAHTQYLLMLKTFKVTSPAAVPTPDGRVPGTTPAQDTTRKRAAFAPWMLRAAAAVATLALGLGWHVSRDYNPPGAVSDDDMWSKVNIVIQVPATLENARLTVSLPQGIYIQGHEGMQTLAWTADFSPGTNALELPIRVDGDAFDRSRPQFLDATLEYQGASKRFEFLVDLDEAVAGTF